QERQGEHNRTRAQSAGCRRAKTARPCGPVNAEGNAIQEGAGLTDKRLLNHVVERRTVVNASPTTVTEMQRGCGR
ncbi:hypothetical protein, partial [Mesorhizobium sp.]|uniref:hypothetical protein n=1 Tax=Mesorhizobium sp. TaxID=1871066 RepID=UPI0025BB8B96